MTTEQIREEIDAIKRAGKKIRRTRASARAFLVKHGFITKSGKLSKRYGG
jgi:hypothetical protein